MEVGNDILPKTLVLGASQKPERYSYLAIRSLKKHGIEVVAIGARKGMVDDIEIHTELQDIPDIHTITLYLSARNQAPYYNYIINLKPKRLIFNPGTENPELEKLAREHGIDVVEGCTLVMLSNGTYYEW
ncbi:CoA-binding protein [Tenuifilum sp.]|mgnify:CR=1 FL=1|jgi:predicted CoA-binding protein|uniref:CoA-binding protein n=1 Tax=Tenuifilum sp. TaxID=2760880 RepID=UPI002C152BBC|nr:CoA-binding protein [Tenuifilum sp.]HPP90806.1 CoA-binding protein [Tenuifilum sp.]